MDYDNERTMKGHECKMKEKWKDMKGHEYSTMKGNTKDMTAKWKEYERTPMQNDRNMKGNEYATPWKENERNTCKMKRTWKDNKGNYCKMKGNARNLLKGKSLQQLMLHFQYMSSKNIKCNLAKIDWTW